MRTDSVDKITVLSRHKTAYAGLINDTFYSLFGYIRNALPDPEQAIDDLLKAMSLTHAQNSLHSELLKTTGLSAPKNCTPFAALTFYYDIHFISKVIFASWIQIKEKQGTIEVKYKRDKCIYNNHCEKLVGDQTTCICLRRYYNCGVIEAISGQKVDSTLDHFSVDSTWCQFRIFPVEVVRPEFTNQPPVKPSLEGLKPISRLGLALNLPLDIHYAIKQLLDFTAHLFAKHHINVTIELDAERSFILGDENKLQQVLLNLISNAKEAVADNQEKEIHIQTKNENGCIILLISDNGTKMNKEMQKKLVKAFFTTKTRYGGLGLGLMLTKSIVQELNGEIDIEFPASVGSTFRLTFRTTSKPSALVGQLVPALANNLKGNVLLCEGDADIADLLTEILTAWGLSVHHASDGKEGLAELKRNRFDIIITDWTMPQMNGEDFIVNVVKQHLSTAPIIVLSCAFVSDYSSFQQKLLNKYVRGYLKKPIDEEAFYALVKACLWCPQ